MLSCADVAQYIFAKMDESAGDLISHDTLRAYFATQVQV